MVVGVTVLVLWLAHVYSRGLGESLAVGRRLTASELAAVARHGFSIPLAAAPPMLSITLAALHVLEGRTAVRIALGIGVATLIVQGVRYALLERLTPVATTITVALNMAVGMVIVALEALVVH